MKNKETLKSAGYSYIKYLSNKTHLLENDFGKFEIWVANKNHASYGLIYKNTHLEFIRSADRNDLKKKIYQTKSLIFETNLKHSHKL